MSAAAIAPTLEPPPPPEAAAVEPRCVHPDLWKACAGSLCAVPPVGAAVYYFPQGHAEQAAAGAADDLLRATPPLVPCRVEAVRLMADASTDDLFAKISLVPLRPGEPVVDVGEAALLQPLAVAAAAIRDGQPQQQQQRAVLSCAKALTQSDANNGGGFSVPRSCARNIFPELDYTQDPPQQWIAARDVHGAEWALRHVYRGRPRRHLLTTGWTNLIHSKNLRTGDTVVFMRGDDGAVHVALRRRSSSSRRGAFRAEGPPEQGRVRVPPEDVAMAATMAAAGKPFDVVKYPGGGAGWSSPDFCVRASAVRESMLVRWCPGLRFKMAFETEDLSRTSWFMGTVTGVAPADPVRWPKSPWRLLQVTWDEPELLGNVNRLCPWQVELVSNMPKLPNFSAPPSKKPRSTSPYTAFPAEEGLQLFDTHFPLPLPLPLPPANHDQNRHGFVVPSFPFPDHFAAAAAAAGIQGDRHPQFAPFFSDLGLSNLQLFGIRSADQQAPPPAPRITTDLRIGGRTTTPGSTSPGGADKGDAVKPPGIMLFGQEVLTEEQMRSSGVLTTTRSGGSSKRDHRDDDKASNNTSDHSGSGVTHATSTESNSASEFGREPGQCNR